MAETALPELPYERIAMAGGEMPDGLSSADQQMFLGLRLLYDSYRKRLIDRDMAKSEKSKLLRNYEKNKMLNAMSQRWVEQIKNTELARADYRKERTIKNADKLLFCVEGGKYYE